MASILNNFYIGGARQENLQEITPGDAHVYLLPFGNPEVHANDLEIGSQNEEELLSNRLVVDCTNASYYLYLPKMADMDQSVIDIENTGTATLNLYYTTAYSSDESTPATGATLSMSVSAGKMARLVCDGSSWIKLRESSPALFKTGFVDNELNIGSARVEMVQSFDMQNYDYATRPPEEDANTYPESDRTYSGVAENFAKIDVDVYLRPYDNAPVHQWDLMLLSSTLKAGAWAAKILALPKAADCEGMVLRIENTGDSTITMNKTTAYSSQRIYEDTSAYGTPPVTTPTIGQTAATKSALTTPATIASGATGVFACDGSDWYEL
jgi:hypothetical protein